MAKSRDIGPGPQDEQAHPIQVPVALLPVQVPKQSLLVENSRLRLNPDAYRQAAEEQIERAMVSGDRDRPLAVDGDRRRKATQESLDQRRVCAVSDRGCERVGLEPHIEPDRPKDVDRFGDRQPRGLRPFDTTDLGSRESDGGTEPILADPRHPPRVSDLAADQLTKPSGTPGVLVGRSIASGHARMLSVTRYRSLTRWFDPCGGSTDTGAQMKAEFPHRMTRRYG